MPGFCKNHVLEEKRAQGKPDAQCTRSLVCSKKAHELVTTGPPKHSGLPTAGAPSMGECDGGMDEPSCLDGPLCQDTKNKGGRAVIGFRICCRACNIGAVTSN